MMKRGELAEEFAILLRQAEVLLLLLLIMQRCELVHVLSMRLEPRGHLQPAAAAPKRVSLQADARRGRAGHVAIPPVRRGRATTKIVRA